MCTSIGPAGSRRAGPPQPTVRSGAPASRADSEPTGRSATRWPPIPPVRAPHGACSDPNRGTETLGTPGPESSEMPTAGGVPAPGGAARSTSNRKLRPRSGRGSVTDPPGPTRSGGVAAPPPTTRTSVGRSAANRAGASRSARNVAAAGVRQASHAGRSPYHGALHAVDESPSNADEPRKPGRPWYLPDELTTTPACGAPATRSSVGSGAAGATVTHPSSDHS